MKLIIALIALLSVSAISAFSLEGFKCRDHTVMTGDPVLPVRTVRICGIEDYAEPPSFLDFKKIAEIADEQQARKKYATNSYGNTGYWSNRVASHSSPPAYARWPLLPQTEHNEEGVQLYSTIYKGLAVQPATYEATANYPATSRDRLAVERLLQEKLRSLTEDTSEMKNSMNDVVAHMKTILATSQGQNANQPMDINVNVNFKLDPAFEALLTDFMALLKSAGNSDAESAESSSTAPIEDSSADNSEDYDSFFSTVNAYENSSEEQVTEAAVDSAEQTTEPDTKEEYDLNSSVEDFDGWLRLHFGPIVKTPTYDEDTDNSEPENSSEKSGESFESWFNAVYRKHTTEAPTDYNSLDEQTQNSQESQEVNVQKESVENSQEIDDQYGYIDVYMNPQFYDTKAKSSEENTVSEETTESSEEADSNISDTLFVPTTMDPMQSSETVELYENGDRYNYATGRYEKMAAEKYECMKSAFLMKDLELIKKNLLKCYTEDQISHEIEESKESAETDAAVTDSNESKSSEETEAAITESNESKSSEETETLINDSNESKSSAETEAAITESNESKSSEETEPPINEWNEYDYSSEIDVPSRGVPFISRYNNNYDDRTHFFNRLVIA